METDGGGWTVVFKFDRTVDRDVLFDSYTARGVIQNMGQAQASGTVTRSMPSQSFTEIGLGCFDSDMTVIAGSFRTQTAAEWNATPFVTGELGAEWLSAPVRHGQQDNTFGFSDNSETLMFSQPNDWREINFVDKSRASPVHTYGRGYVVWRTGSQHGRDRECNNSPVSTENQLTLLVR
jgi:hypothetical protein